MTASSILVQAGTSTLPALINKYSGSEEILTLQTGGINAVVVNEILTVTFSSTGATKIPSGTTAQRPSSPVNGMLRYNTTLSRLEGYSNGNWGVLT